MQDKEAPLSGFIKFDTRKPQKNMLNFVNFQGFQGMNLKKINLATFCIYFQLPNIVSLLKEKSMLCWIAAPFMCVSVCLALLDF